ncbi:MAG: glycosyltransferase, partial [Verrucomicrobiota bacterium]
NRIALLIRNSATTYDRAERTFSTSAKILGFVLRRFHRWTKSRKVRFFTDSSRLAEEYRALAGLDIEVVPHPVCIDSSAACDREKGRAPDKPLTLICPGPARWEKGAQLLLAAMSEIGRSDIRCVLQWPDPVRSPAGVVVEPDSALCEIVTEPLSSEEYKSLLCQADCIVLPYLREFYYARISGIAVEAMRLGIPLIYCEDTWVADMVGLHGSGIGFPSGDATALAECIRKFSADRETWQRAAETAAASAKSYFSAEHFLDVFWKDSDIHIETK